MGSSLLDQQGQLHIVHGTVTGSGTASVSCNDGSITLTDNGTGDYTLTIGDAFLSTPTVLTCAVDTFAATDGLYGVTVVSSATTSVQFNAVKSGDNDTDGAAADMSFGFVLIGLRNN